jgi:lactate racemase
VRLDVDFGRDRLRISVPDDAAVLQFVDSPACRDLAPVPELVRRALAEPLDMPPLAALVRPGATVTIAFDDPLRAPATVRAVLPVLLETLAARGVAPDRMRLISANGMHRKFSPAELRAYLSPNVADAVGSERIVNHDSTDEGTLLDFGRTALGDRVRHHRALAESDLTIYVGNIGPNVWGGHGGTGAVIGLAAAESIADNHAREVIGAEHSCHGDQHRMLYQRHKEAVAWQLEKASGRQVFYVEGIADDRGVREVFAGHFAAIRRAAWPVADRTFEVAAPPADALVVGLPERLLYGEVDNPLIALTGLGFVSRMWRHAPVLREGGVVIGVSPSRGVVDAESHPSYEEVIRLYGEAGSVDALSAHERGHLSRRHGRGYHPAHPFWLFYEDEYLLRRAGRIILAGAAPSPLTRALGIEVAADWDTAWAMARESVGPAPRTLVAPTYWTRPRIKFAVNA